MTDLDIETAPDRTHGRKVFLVLPCHATHRDCAAAVRARRCRRGVDFIDPRPPLPPPVPPVVGAGTPAVALAPVLRQGTACRNPARRAATNASLRRPIFRSKRSLYRCRPSRFFSRCRWSSCCGPGCTVASRSSTTSHGARDEQSARGLGRTRSTGAAEAANAGASCLGRHRTAAIAYPHEFQETHFCTNRPCRTTTESHLSPPTALTDKSKGHTKDLGPLSARCFG